MLAVETNRTRSPPWVRSFGRPCALCGCDEVCFLLLFFLFFFLFFFFFSFFDFLRSRGAQLPVFGAGSVGPDTSGL